MTLTVPYVNYIAGLTEVLATLQLSMSLSASLKLIGLRHLS